MEKESKNKHTLPLIPLEEVLACMTDKDMVVRMAGKAYYNIHYTNANSSHNDRPSR